MAGNIVVEWSSAGGGPLLKELQQAESGFKKTQAAVKALSAEARSLSSLSKGFALTGEIQKLSQQLGLSQRQVSAAVQRLQQLNAAGASTQQRFAALNKELGVDAQAFLALDRSVAQYNARVQQAAAATDRATAELADQAAAAKRSAEALQEIEQAQQQVGLGAAAFTAAGVLALEEIIAGAIAAQKQYENLGTAINAASGSPIEGAQNLDFVNEQVDKLSISLPVAADGFVKLAAAAKGTEVEGKGVQDIFAGIAAQARANNLTNQQLEKAYLALSQSLSKGKLTAEELNTQLNEALPGSTTKFALALGVSTQELLKMVTAGEVGRAELVKFGQFLQNDAAASIEAGSQTIGASFSRLETEVFRLQVSVGQAIAPITKTFVDGATATTKAFNSLNPVFQIAILSAGGLTAAITLLSAAIVANNALQITRTAALTAQAIATQAVTLSSGGYNAVLALLNTQITLNSGAIATQTAALTASVAGFNAATAAAGRFALATLAAAAPLIALGAAVGALALVVYTNQLRETNDEIQRFAGSVDVAANEAFAAANRTKSAVQELNKIRQTGRGLTKQELDDAEKLFAANERRLEGLREQVKEQQAATGGDASQKQARENLIQTLNTSIKALEGQNAALAESAGLSGNAAAAADAQAQSLEKLREEAQRLREEEFQDSERTISRQQDDEKLARERSQAEQIERLQRSSQEEIAQLQKDNAEVIEQRQKQNAREIGEIQKRQQDQLNARQREFEDEQQRFQEEGQRRIQETERAAQARAQERERVFQEQEREIQEREEQGFDREQQLINRQLEVEEIRNRRVDREDERLSREEQRLDREREIALADPSERSDLRDRFREEDAQARREEQIDRQQATQRQRLEEQQAQQRFQDEDALAARRAELEAPLEAARDAAQAARQARELEFQKQQESTELAFEQSTLAPLRQQLEDQIEARKLAFEQGPLQALRSQQEAALEAIRTSQEATLQQTREAQESRLNQLRQTNEDELNRIRQQAADRERALDRQYEDEKLAREEAFRAQQRQLDLANSQQIAGILAGSTAAAGLTPFAGGRRSGGPVEPGKAYLVGEAGPEFIVPRHAGFVLTANRTRQIAAEAMNSIRQPTLSAIAQSSSNAGYGSLLREIKAMRSDVQKLRSPHVGSQSITIQNSMPRDEQKMRMEVERQYLDVMRELRRRVEE